MTRAPGGRFGRSFTIMFVLLAVSAGVLTGCGPERKAGTRCNTKELAHDATHILQCKNKRWRRIMTRQQAVAFWIAIMNKKKEDDAAAAAAAAAKAAAAPPTTPFVAPAPGIPSEGPATLAAGDLHSCAITPGGGVKCWGSNISGQGGRGYLGAGGVPASTPVAVTNVSGVTNIAAYGSTTCAVVAGGHVKCWGENTDGQVGNNTYGSFANPIYEPTPVEVLMPDLTPLSGAVRVDVGVSFACALISDGSVYCWGGADEGRLGNLTGSGRYPTAQRVQTGFGPLGDAATLSLGYKHGCVTTHATTVWCWGLNTAGQVGVGTSGVNPPDVRYGAEPVKWVSWAGSGYLWGAWSVSAGVDHTCAITGFQGSSVVRCWGNATWGQLGFVFPGSVNQASDLYVTGLDARAIAAGYRYTCGIDAFGGVQCWGSNTVGQFGSGSVGGSYQPVAVPGVSGAVDVVSGVDHSCARRNDGAVLCWGNNDLSKAGGLGYPAVVGPTLIPL